MFQRVQSCANAWAAKKYKALGGTWRTTSAPRKKK